MTTSSYDAISPVSQVRLLISDVSAPWVFTDDEIETLLTLERGVVKLAAAQAIDSQATNEALASKVLRSDVITTDGAKLADAMRKHAAALRAQAADEAASADDGFFFLTPGAAPTCPELTERPVNPIWWQ